MIACCIERMIISNGDTVSYSRIQFHFDLPNTHKRTYVMLLDSVRATIFSVNMCNLCSTCHFVFVSSFCFMPICVSVIV